MGWREGAHPVLDLADVGIDRHQRLKLTQPVICAMRMATAPGRGDLARGYRPGLPERDGEQNQPDGKCAGRCHEGETKAGGEIAEGQRRLAVAAHGTQRGLVLVVDMTEQFDRLDVGDRVHDLPRHVGACRGPSVLDRTRMRGRNQRIMKP